jgi:hypothetical protein
MNSMLRNVSTAVLVLAGASSARAQNFNIDIGEQPPSAGVPSLAYGGAAGQSGFWNAVSPTSTVPVPLTDIAGLPSGAVLGVTGGGSAFQFDNPGTVGDDNNLMDDGQTVGLVPVSTTWTFSGLQSGDYRLYTYAWAGDNPASQSTVSAGMVTGRRTVGGAWPGQQQEGVTYAVHLFSIQAGAQISVMIASTAGIARVNGFQLVLAPPPGTYLCFGDGSGTQCPAGNNSPAGAAEGCLNSMGMGALITAFGNPSISNDTLVLHGSQMLTGPCLYFQGNNLVNGGAGAVFGDGLLCVNTQVARLAIKFNGHGSSTFPEPGDPSVSSQGFVSTPGFKYYEVWYRDAALFGTPSTFNTSRTVCIPWVP